MEPCTVIDLIPGNVPVRGYSLNGEQFIALASVDAVLVEMQLNNAKHSEGKPEYDELLANIRERFSKAVWTEKK